MIQFVNGAIMMGLCVAAIFFARFWRRTRDIFFLLFAISFALLAINRVFLAWLANSHGSEHQIVLYGVRLLAFTIILLAILLKNRKT